MVNPLALLAALLERLFNRIAPQPKPRSVAAEKGVVVPFSRRCRPALTPSRTRSHSGREPARLR